MPKLTNKQKRFCEEYLIDLNATQAAIRAGYSKKTADRIASENLRKLEIQHCLGELMQARAEATGVTAERVVRELETVAFAEAEITGREKIKALELLGKHLGMFEPKLAPPPDDTAPDALSESLRKLAEELDAND